MVSHPIQSDHPSARLNLRWRPNKDSDAALPSTMYLDEWRSNGTEEYKGGKEQRQGKEQRNGKAGKRKCNFSAAHYNTEHV